MRRLAALQLALGVLAAVSLGAPMAAAHPGHDACAVFQNQAIAQHYFLTHGGPASDPHGMDPDGDGIACESLPCPCNLSTTPPPAADPTPISDRDGDGVPDTADLCPDVPAPVTSGCPGDLPPEQGGVPRPTVHSGVVTGVVDGRTLRVRVGGRTETVRLLGLGRAGCDARKARSTLLWLTFTAPRDRDADGLLDRRGGGGAPVEIVTDPSQPARDRRRRLLAYVTVDGLDLARAQLRRGRASVDLTPQAFERITAYKAVEARAREAGRGLWGRCRGR